MNETLRVLMERKSVRVFEKRPIGPEEKQAILNAAMRAPTAGNSMLYSILDVTDQALKDKLAITCDHQPFIAAAPMVLVFWRTTAGGCGNSSRRAVRTCPHPG